MAALRTRIGELSRRRTLALLCVTVLVLHAPQSVQESVRADPTVTVETAYGGYVVRDADSGPETLGIVLYLGGSRRLPPVSGGHRDQGERHRRRRRWNRYGSAVTQL